MRDCSVPSACVLQRQRAWGLSLCYWLVFLKVIDIRNGEQLKHSFTFIFRIFRGKTRTVWSVLREEKVYSEGKYQREKMQPWERVRSSRQAGNEKAQTGVHLPPGSWRRHVREVGAGVVHEI